METSLSQQIEITCPSCQQQSLFTVWLVIDVIEHAELVELLRLEALHNEKCPYCGFSGQLDFPLLIYHPVSNPVLIFSPAQQSNPEQDQEQATQLLGWLKHNIGNGWHDEWIADMPIIPRWLLFTALTEGIQSAFAKYEEKTPLVEAMQEMFLANTWEEVQQCINTHRELLTKEVEVVLDRLINQAEINKDLDSVHLFKQRQLLLQYLLEMGIEQAFERKSGIIFSSRQDLLRVELSILNDDQQKSIFELLDQTGNSDAFLEELKRQPALYSAVKRAIETVQNNIDNEIKDTVDLLSSPAIPREIPYRIDLCWQLLLKVDPSDKPELWAWTENILGNFLAQSPYGNRAKNLELAINHYNDALEIRTYQSSPEDWAGTHNNLGNAFGNRVYGDRGNNLEQAIDHFNKALEIYTFAKYPVEWATTQNNLGNAYHHRIRGERGVNLEEAIQHFQEALEFQTRDRSPRDWAATLNNLASAYSDRIKGNRDENLEKAIESYKIALTVYTRQEYPELWATTQNNLGLAYLKRSRGSFDNNIEQAISYFQSALTIHTRQASPYDWAMIHHNLGNAFGKRVQGNRANNLEQAIKHLHQVLEVRTPEILPNEWAMTQNNLGNAYGDRIYGDRAENQEQAIQHFRQALSVHTQEMYPEDWATVINNLGSTYCDRILGDKEANLELAIDYFEQALKVYTRSEFPQDWAGIQNNLGMVYSKRINGDLKGNIEKAIEHFKQALEIRTYQEFPLDWANTQNNLASSYHHRICGNKKENLEQAIVHYQWALEVRTRQDFPEDWATIQINLGNLYKDWLAGDYKANWEQAINYYQQALLELRPEINPAKCRIAAESLGELGLKTKRWEYAVRGFKAACACDEILFQAALFDSSKEKELKEAENLYGLAGYSLAKIGDYNQAVEKLEAGRARLLRDALERSRRDLDLMRQQGHGELYERYQQASQIFQSLLANQSKQASIARLTDIENAQRELQQVVEAIRSLPRYKDFLQSLSSDSIQSLSIEEPIVYLTVTNAGGLALIVQPYEITPLWLDELTELSLREHVLGSVNNTHNFRGYLGSYINWRESEGKNKELAEVEWHKALDNTTAWLWSVAISEIVQLLSDQGIRRAILIPTGLLGLLPLHAAWVADPDYSTGRRYALDEVNFTYAPSAYALRQAKQIANRPINTILAVDDPGGSLPSSAHEVDVALEQFPKQCRARLSGSKATKQAVLKTISYYPLLHFSTHGEAGFTQPLDGYLLMANQEKLTLREVMGLKLDHSRLAVLSACETGIPGLNLPNEVISLPTGFMQAGVPGVIGSLWTVSEYSTMLLMTKFYENWQRGEKMSLAEALHQAQIWLRDSRVCDFEVYLRQSMRIPVIEKLPENVAHQVYWQLHDLDPNLRPFAHPYYWAAFSLTGV